MACPAPFAVLLLTAVNLLSTASLRPTCPEVQCETLEAPSYRQVLDNFHDLQYYADMTLGTQTLRAVLDTGSVEFVVLSDKCKYWCGKEELLYHPHQSRDYKNGTLTLVLSYASGQLLGHEAYDSVTIGPLKAKSSPFWEIADANMPMLFDSDFRAIVGLGPIPLNMTSMEPGSTDNSNKFAVLLKKLHVDRFSVCLGQDPGSVGYFTWNDDAHMKMPDVFTEVAAKSTGYWMVQLSQVWLGDKLVACDAGCGAVLDSGTSMLALPQVAHREMRELIELMDTDCSDLSGLPDLHFKLNGQDYSLPPDAYMARIQGVASLGVQSHFEMREMSECQAALMHITMDSSLGAVWILGMPFFRKFYTVFAQNTPSKPATLYTAPADEECRPATGSDGQGLLGKPRSFRSVKARSLDASKLRMAPWVSRTRKGGLLDAGVMPSIPHTTAMTLDSSSKGRDAEQVS